MEKVILGLGGNVGDVRSTLESALSLLASRIGPLEKRSEIIKTEPWGKTDQPVFLNGCASFVTHLTPKQVLSHVLAIEIELGRVRKKEEKWGPRKIDLDILLWGSLVMQTKNLTLPHPYLHERDFVLTPLKEIAPNSIHPVLHLPIKQIKA